MKILISNCSVLFVLVLVVFGCKTIGRLGKSNYFEGDNAKIAAEAIREKVGKPFNVAEVFIDKDEFRVHAQDPNNPKNLDEYKYIGGFVTGPNPVKLDGMNENLAKSTFPFDEINFAAIPEFAREAIEKAGIEGGQIYRMTFQRGFAMTETGLGSLGNAYWHIEIKGTREDVSAAADPKGKLLGVDLSLTSQAANYRLITKEELKKAQDALIKVIGINRQISKISLDDKMLSCRVLNQENPTVQDSYQYGINGVTQKEVLKMPVIAIPGYSSTFSLSDINLPDAVTFVEKAKTRVNLPDAAIGFISIEQKKSSFSSKDFQIIWTVFLKKGVNEGSVDYDNEGSETLVRKNGKVMSNKK